MTRGIHSREIVKSDLDEVASLLAKALGFSKEYFSQILEKITDLSTPVGFPKYGFVLLSDGVIVGAILMIFTTIRSGAVRCHVTSWAVEPAYRSYGALFFSKALKYKDVTYLNIQANPRSFPFIELQGFSMFSQGQFAAIPVLGKGSGDRSVKLVSADAVPNSSVNARRAGIAANPREIWVHESLVHNTRERASICLSTTRHSSRSSTHILS